jgi:hypothetical protein
MKLMLALRCSVDDERNYQGNLYRTFIEPGSTPGSAFGLELIDNKSALAQPNSEPIRTYQSEHGQRRPSERSSDWRLNPSWLNHCRAPPASTSQAFAV